MLAKKPADPHQSTGVLPCSKSVDQKTVFRPTKSRILAKYDFLLMFFRERGQQICYRQESQGWLAACPTKCPTEMAQTDRQTVINDKMTIVGYEKD